MREHFVCLSFSGRKFENDRLPIRRWESSWINSVNVLHLFSIRSPRRVAFHQWATLTQRKEDSLSQWNVASRKEENWTSSDVNRMNVYWTLIGLLTLWLHHVSSPSGCVEMEKAVDDDWSSLGGNRICLWIDVVTTRNDSSASERSTWLWPIRFIGHG